MSPTARLYGGPKDGELLTLEKSVPYELTLPVLVEVPKVEDGEAVVITGSIVYRRRGDYLEALALDEPVVYVFVGPAKRGSRR